MTKCTPNNHEDREDDGKEFILPKSKSNKGGGGGGRSLSSSSSSHAKRVYMGNLPNGCIDLLETQIRTVLHDQVGLDATNVGTVTVHRKGKSPYAIIDCGPYADTVIAKLHHYTLQGKTLVVQREQRRGGSSGASNTTGNKGRKPSSSSSSSSSSVQFGGWTKPSATVISSSSSSSNERKEDEKKALQPFINVEEATERIGHVIAGEIEQAERDGDDFINVSIAAAAAATLFTSLNVALEEKDDNNLQDDDPSMPMERQDHEQKETQEDEELDFHARRKQPLSSLLADFGEADPNWMKRKPANGVTSTDPAIIIDDEENSRLARQGKAPIHVDFISFGYVHGAPPEIRNKGWTYSNPLPPYDCREFEQVPHYLEWRDGLSGAVRRALLENSKGNIRKSAAIAAERAEEALIEAIQAGHGYALPLTMGIYVGSHLGRHRSVLYCELAATALRKLLRTNTGNRILQPVSVGTSHLHLDRRHKTSEEQTGRKKNDLEGEW